MWFLFADLVSKNTGCAKSMSLTKDDFEPLTKIILDPMNPNADLFCKAFI